MTDAQEPSILQKPSILAPAVDKNSFLAAVAAGADAIYCGLKIFSARMEAENFGPKWAKMGCRPFGLLDRVKTRPEIEPFLWKHENEKYSHQHKIK